MTEQCDLLLVPTTSACVSCSVAQFCRFLCALLVLLPSNDRQCLRRKVPCTITDRGMSVPVLTTPLHTAARQGLYRNVFRLMEAGANNSLYEVLDTARQPLYQYRQRQAASVAANPRTYTDKVNRVLSRKIRMQLLAEVEVAEQAGTDIANMVSSYIAE